MTEALNLTQTLEKIHRLSDQSCTAHAGLRDHYTRFALGLDLLILGLSTWIVALAFVDPEISSALTPFKLATPIWIGLLGVGTFFLTVVQMKTDWKGRADAHTRAVASFSEAKQESGYLLASGDTSERAFLRALGRYDLAAATSVEIPEREFLRQKKRHKLKVELSKHLDTRPGASLLLAKLRILLRDNRSL